MYFLMRREPLLLLAKTFTTTTFGFCIAVENSRKAKEMSCQTRILD